jgi:hypothetical protein
MGPNMSEGTTMAYRRDGFSPVQGTTRMAPGHALDDLLTRVGDAIRQVRGAVSTMSPSESELLTDMARGRGLTMLCGLCGVSERAFREADALSVAEAIRGHILARRRHRAGGVLGVLDAFEQEEATNGPANLAQWLFATNPSKATRDVAVERLAHQEAASRVAIDVLHTLDLDSPTRRYLRCS